ncbi:MAG: hypothetical protein SFV15_04160, partial [Polyangiaceae bacterium]|nr:hypothetical protein [Polyangiaceae bacterium]
MVSQNPYTNIADHSLGHPRPRSGGKDVDADFEGSLDVDPELDFLRRGERESAVVEEGAKLRLASENRARLKSDKEDEVGHASSDGRDNKRGQST